METRKSVSQRRMIKIKRILELTQNDGYYFPLFNFRGLRGSITPFFGGDLKLDQHHFLLEPTSETDLFSNIFSRNVVFRVDGDLFFLNGQTSLQQTDSLTWETGLLYAKVRRANSRFVLETTSYVTLDADTEVHEIRFTNASSGPLLLEAVTAVPMYDRSADNLRDHRHVTSLLNRVRTVDRGILNRPTLSFDERGHRENRHVYGVFADSPDLRVDGYLPVLDDFVGGGSLHFPKGLDNRVPEGTSFDGFEAMGGIAFAPRKILPGQTVSLYVSIGVADSFEAAEAQGRARLSAEAFRKGLEAVSAHFAAYCSRLQFRIADPGVSDRLDWTVLQPLLRRVYGCSFLPHHDYGRGGRGWRDLWQDLLSLILMNDPEVPSLLFNNFQGIRIDGSNATIIGDLPGDFLADRNKITRVWSDHGAWPLLTVQMFVEETGNLDFLLREAPYFMDQFTHYTHASRPLPPGTRQTDASGAVYLGTLLEHLLLENLVAFHNLGEHGFLRLEDADWNDGLDMAGNRGESVAFTHLYAGNLLSLADLVRRLPEEKIAVFSDLVPLLDETADLSRFFAAVERFSGTKILLDRSALASALERLGNARMAFLRERAFRDGRFQSHFDDDGKDLDASGTISLSGQAMALLAGTATPSQARSAAASVRQELFAESLGGYRLNSDHHEVLTRMGRAFGFAYGHKENGAVFSHMALMYACGLYRYGLVPEGREAVFALLRRAEDPAAKVWAGIPEYFNPRGEGKYSYLTGSASWLLILMRTDLFGVRFRGGAFTLDPRLMAADFIAGKASLRTCLFGNVRTITYHNPKGLEYGSYRIAGILADGKESPNRFASDPGDIEVYLDEIR